jgi:hypothetical protein
MSLECRGATGARTNAELKTENSLELIPANRVHRWVERESHKSVLNPEHNIGGTVMNSVIYLVGLVVVVLAILSFLGLH